MEATVENYGHFDYTKGSIFLLRYVLDQQVHQGRGMMALSSPKQRHCTQDPQQQGQSTSHR